MIAVSFPGIGTFTKTCIEETRKKGNELTTVLIDYQPTRPTKYQPLYFLYSYSSPDNFSGVRLLQFRPWAPSLCHRTSYEPDALDVAVSKMIKGFPVGPYHVLLCTKRMIFRPLDLCVHTELVIV